jgi:quinol monooxygenase YgiN
MAPLLKGNSRSVIRTFGGSIPVLRYEYVRLKLTLYQLLWERRIAMIKLNIDVKTHLQKNAEFLQTLDQLLGDLRREEGNLEYGYQQSEDDLTKIRLWAEWQTWENLERHLKGEYFTILLGAIRVLCEEPVVKIDNESEISGTDMIDKWSEKYKT